MILIKHLLCAAAVTLFASSAFAAPEDDYVVYKTAARINEACGGLKYLEHVRTLAAASAALGNTTEDRMSLDGRMPEAEYKAWLAALDAKVTEQVHAVGCTEQAMQFVIRGKGIANEGIYRGLVLAIHFASLPPTDIMGYVALEPDRLAAVQRYDGYLQALYRENFAAFAARQKEIAIQELPVVNPFDDGYALGLGAMLASPGEIDKTANAQSIAASAVDDVFFEVIAETAGFVVRPVDIEGQWTTPELRTGTAVQQPGYIVVDGPSYDLVDLTPEDDDQMPAKLYRAVTLKSDGGLRVMFYGDNATKVAAGTARLYIRNQPIPANTTAYQFFASPEFRDGAIGIDGTPVTSGCLSTACFDFPAEATRALIADPGNPYAELFVSTRPGAQPDPQTEVSSYKSGRVSNFYAIKLLRE